MSLARELSEPPAIPARAGTPNRQILFHHPGYDDSNNVLLKLFAPDLGQNSTGCGLYAQYALEACGIITGNRWEGWLSEVKDPGASARINTTSILRKSSYYFHLPPLQRDIDADYILLSSLEPDASSPELQPTSTMSAEQIKLSEPVKPPIPLRPGRKPGPDGDERRIRTGASVKASPNAQSPSPVKGQPLNRYTKIGRDGPEMKLVRGKSANILTALLRLKGA